MRKLLLIVVMLLVARNLAYAGNEANRYAKFQEQQRQLVEEARNAEEKSRSNPESAQFDSKNAASSPEDDQPKKIVENLINRQKAEEEKKMALVEKRRKDEALKFRPDRLLADSNNTIKSGGTPSSTSSLSENSFPTCYDSGYKYGRCGEMYLKGKWCDPGASLVIPEHCRGKAEFQRGANDGGRSVR